MKNSRRCVTLRRFAGGSDYRYITPMFSRQNHVFQAGLYMVLCTASFVCGDSFIKIIGNTLPVGQIMAVLGLLSCVFLLVICAQQGILRHTPMIFSRAIARSTGLPPNCGRPCARSKARCLRFAWIRPRRS